MQILAQGMTAGVGDLLHPSGALNPVTYGLVGTVYRYIESCEPFVAGGSLVTEVAVIVDPDLGDTPGPAGFGTVRALQQLRQQFDIVAPTADLFGYALLIVPETTTIDEALAAKLTAYADRGGAVFISRGAADGTNGVERLTFTGANFQAESPFSNVFIRPEALLGGAAGFDHVMYDRTLRMTPTGGAEVLATIIEPLFEREWDQFSGHEYTPTSNVASDWAAVVQQGNTITAAIPLLQALGNHGAPAYRALIGKCLDRLLPRPLVRAGGPVHLETSVVRTPNALVVHLLSFLSTRVADVPGISRHGQQGLDLIEDPFPLVAVAVAIRSEREPQTVALEPHGEVLEFTWRDGYVHTVVTVLSGHAMIVMCFA